MSSLNKAAKQLEKLLDKRLDQSEKKVGKQYAKLLNEIRNELAKIYEKYEVNGVLTYAEMAKYDRLTKFLEYVNSLLDVNYKDLKKTIYNILEESYEDGYYMTAWAIETDSLSKLKYSSVSSDVIIAAIENPISGIKLSHRLEKQRADVIYKIQQEVTQGLVKGESYKTMATRIKEALEGDANKSMRVVRTEAHRVQESSKLDSAIHANKNGVVMLKEWNSVGDQRVRHKSSANHRLLNGDKIPVNDEFEQGLGKGPAPGQMGVASHDINCRCFLSYTIENVEKVATKELEKMTFETWKNGLLSNGNNNSNINNLEKAIKDDIINGKYKLKVKKESFEKHLKGHRRYNEYQEKNKNKGIFGPSYLTISLEETQFLIDKYAGKGLLSFDKKGQWVNKELIDAGKIIGIHVNLVTGKETETQLFYIHYSKSGTHIVPTLKKED